MSDGPKDSQSTMIRGRWIVAFDGREHRILEDGVVVFRGDAITHVGKAYAGKVDETIDAGRHLVIPGLVNTHVHVGSQSGDRMILDAGRRDLMRSGFLNYYPTKGIRGRAIFDFEDRVAAKRYSLASLLRYGSTTVVEMGEDPAEEPGLAARLAGELGLRIYTAPGYSSAMHYFDQAGRRQTHWDEALGMKDLARAVEFASAWDGKYEGRVRAILVPWEVHLSSAELLQKTKSAARELGVGITLHVAESMLEFQDIVRGTGHTPVGWLADLGILGPEVILGHCLYLGGHSQTAYPFAGDLDAIAGSGASVAHCPLVFGRRGVTLESFQRYLDHGVNMSTGTDSYPQDLLGELKFVSVLSKVADRSFESANVRDVFNAATLGGAKALRRPDLGRLAPGAKADIVIVDFERLRIGPFLDPIKALIHCADGDAIERVIVAGKTLVEGGRLIVWDERELLESVRRSTARAWGRFPEYFALNQSIDEAYPPAFKPWHG